MKTLYKIRLMFEWGGGCLWCVSDQASERFGVGPIEDRLPLSAGTRRRLHELSVWHDQALDWRYPPDRSPWSSEESNRFAEAARTMLEAVQVDLGPDFEVVYQPL